MILGDKDWPRTAHVVDVVRCSLTFDNAKDMMESIDKFEKLIKQDKGGCIRSIIRRKNSFVIYDDLILKKAKTIEDRTRLVQSLPLNKFKYCDLKLNVVIDHKGRAIIGEIQFLIKYVIVIFCVIMSHASLI